MSKSSLRIRRGRIYMTLIAAIPTPKGLVVSADTEEMCPSYDINGNTYELRKTVQKITPETIGNYQIAIAGSGHAQLIDTFIVKAHRATAGAGQSAIELRNSLERELDSFYRNDVAICQDADKDFKLFVLYFCSQTREHGVWVSERTVLRDIGARPELIGWEHQLYFGTVNRLFRADMPIAQAVLAGLYVLTIGDETSNYIKKPFHVAVVRDDGIWMEEAGDIKTMIDRLESFEKGINRLFLACAENTPHAVFESTLAKFTDEARKLHRFQGIMVSKLVAYAVLGPPQVTPSDSQTSQDQQ